LGPDNGGAARIVFGESDGLPGLIADLYSRTLVIQLVSAGMDRRREAVVGLLRRVVDPECVVERSDTGNREREGLKPARGIIHGALPEDGKVPFTAEGLLLQADPLGGQKTGFYLDQRDSWTALRPLARGLKVLDACCYTGAFGLSLLKGGADSLAAIDSSNRAIKLAEEAARRNGLEGRAKFIEGDAGAVMAEMARGGESFGLVVLDPPALAKTRAHRVLASRAVRALNDAAVAVVEPGGLLFTCSCTPWITGDDLAESVALSAARLGRRASVLEVRGQSRDHPAHPLMPETRYLSGLLAHVA
jgi:23S rRNA (cytosine1962-C5)-methyltransferase